jgi:hypothetical protein
MIRKGINPKMGFKIVPLRLESPINAIQVGYSFRLAGG